MFNLKLKFQDLRNKKQPKQIKFNIEREKSYQKML